MLLRLTIVTAILLAFPAMAEGDKTFTDKNDATYTLLQERPYTDALKATMVRIENGDSVILMEMALDCSAEQYGYLGMVFDLPSDGETNADKARVIGYSDSIRTDRIGGVSLTELDANLENDSVVALFDMGCGRL